ncbi:MAG: hypothetical protein V7731_04305 [Amphritea sp.]
MSNDSIRTSVFHWQVQILFVPLLLSILSFGIRAEMESDSVSGTSPPDVDSQVANIPDFPPLHQFDEVIERPLFNQGRKPQAKPSAPTGGNEQALRETWKLTGITITTERVMALFSERNGSKRLRLEVDMPLDDHWQLEEIEPDGVSVVSGDQEVRLQLRQPRESLPASPASSKAPAKKAKKNTDNDSTASGSNRTPTLKSVPRAGKIQTM